jgi:hypothetical protein
VRGLIDDDKAHHQVLYQLGILDDEEDWSLFCKMQSEQFEDDIDIEIWWKYVTDRRYKREVT